MSKTLIEIAQELKNSKKKVQLIYAFNGTGKTRLSREFKNLINPKTIIKEDGTEEEQGSELEDKKILYFSAFTEDLFHWDNDLVGDKELKLKILPNTFTHRVFVDEGLEKNVTNVFKYYTNDKIEPNFNADFSEVTFSYIKSDDEKYHNIKISKGEESNFTWSIFYTLFKYVTDILNISEISDRSTNIFDNIQYVFIDDPVSSLDDNHLIQLAVDLSSLIKSSNYDVNKVKFIITTHNPLFFNVLCNELGSIMRPFVKTTN